MVDFRQSHMCEHARACCCKRPRAWSGAHCEQHALVITLAGVTLSITSCLCFSFTFRFFCPDNELAALAVNRYELGKELQFPATCLPFDWSAEPCDLSPGDGAALVLCLPLLYCFSFFAVGPDKCGWNLDEPTLCWCCFCCAAWPSAIYKYTPYNPEQHHPRLPGGTTEHGTNDAASTVRYPSLLSELEDAASAQSFTRGTAVNNGIIINAMRLLRRPRADSFGREYPLKVKTVAGDVYTVVGWGAADDLHAAILAEHPELAPHYFDSTTDGTNQQHAPFGLYSNDKRCIWLDPAYHSSTRDDMLATQKSAEVCLLYNRNAGVRDNNGQADSPTALIAKSHSKVALFV